MELSMMKFVDRESKGAGKLFHNTEVYLLFAYLRSIFAICISIFYYAPILEKNRYLSRGVS